MQVSNDLKAHENAKGVPFWNIKEQHNIVNTVTLLVIDNVFYAVCPHNDNQMKA